MGVVYIYGKCWLIMNDDFALEERKIIEFGEKK